MAPDNREIEKDERAKILVPTAIMLLSELRSNSEAKRQYARDNTYARASAFAEVLAMSTNTSDTEWLRWGEKIVMASREISSPDFEASARSAVNDGPGK